MKAVFDHIEKYDMLPEGAVVYAAVSGGIDSMCMLHLLYSVGEKYGITVKALHYNHKLRGEESDLDESFVRRTCEEWGIELICGSGDVNKYAAERKMSTEQAAREMRYKFFESSAEEGSLVATAHNADDNLETMLFNLARGTALTGLCGIPPRRGRYIRPMLPVSRAHIEKYITENAILYREDSTNALDIYTRNILRHKVLPVLREISPSAAENVFRTSEMLRQDDECLDKMAQKFIENELSGGKISIDALKSLDTAISGRVIKTLCPECDAGHIKSVLSLCGEGVLPSAKVSIPEKTVKREYGKIVFSEENEPEEWDGFFISPGETHVIEPLGLSVSAEECIFDGDIDKSFTIFVFKSADICGKISVRPRKTGDRIRLNGGSKTLKKLYIEKKVPLSQRDSVPVIADGENTLAVYGLCRSIHALPAVGDTVLKIRFGETDQK